MSCSRSRRWSLGLAAPAAYTLSTVAHPHSGAIPTAGPASAAGGSGGFGAGANRGFAGRRSSGRRFGGFPNAGGANPGGPAPGSAGPAADGPAEVWRRRSRAEVAEASAGCSTARIPSAAVTALFDQSSGFRWTAAAIGANNAAGYQLASGKAIMAIGGFNGTDPTPTLAQFEQYVDGGEIHYFIASGGGAWSGRRGASSTSSAITAVGGAELHGARPSAGRRSTT